MHCAQGGTRWLNCGLCRLDICACGDVTCHRLRRSRSTLAELARFLSN